MQSETEILEKLHAEGISLEEAERIYKEVGAVIVTQALLEYVKILPTDLQTRIQTLETHEVEAFLAEHKDGLPKFPMESYEKIHTKVWEEYFSSVGKTL
jgi:hypothetical protein